MALIAGIGLAAGLGGCASAPPAAPAVPDDPKIAEALGHLDSNVPASCKQYANAKCRAASTGKYPVEVCDGYVAAINAMVKKYGANACDDWAQGLPK